MVECVDVNESSSIHYNALTRDRLHLGVVPLELVIVLASFDEHVIGLGPRIVDIEVAYAMISIVGEGVLLGGS